MDATTQPDDRPLALPPSQPPAQAPPFPVVASIAPLVASGAIWAITQSPFALVFAGLSPIIALAGVADGRWNARKARRRAASDRAQALTRLRSDIATRHTIERAALRVRTPSARAAMHDTGRITRWSSDADWFARLAVGTGAVPASLRLGGEPQADDERQLMAEAATLARAPVVADAALGIGLIGPAVLTRGVARGYLVQLMHAFAPGTATVARVPAAEWEWAKSLPQFAAGLECDSGRDPGSAHRINVVSVRCADDPADADPQIGVHSPAAHHAVIAMARSLDRLPVPCRVVVEITGPATAHVVTGAHVADGGVVVPELISEAQAAAYALQLAEHAAATGLVRTHGELPASVSFRELEHGAAPSEESSPGPSNAITTSSTTANTTSLRAVVGLCADRPLVLDLVDDGPHAVVGGTTGSGKSEFLTAWVAAMAATHTPREVGFLLVDFKGGSTFAALTGLAHCVGLITDLGHGEARRALSSLKAELRHRERVLARLGARDITQAPGELGRLVIIVDEFAAMLDTFPELHALFVDIAARGRSLGVHAILCTQRPAGVVRDALLANCSLRISLRVNNADDSVAVIGTDAASRLSAAHPGRCIVARDGSRLIAQIAQTTTEDIERVARASSVAGAGMQAPRRPWLDPLPALVPVPPIDTPTGAVILGIEDAPEEQRQSVVAVDQEHLHLLATGVHGSGKSVFAHTIEQQWCGELHTADGDLEVLWDALAWAQEWCDRGDRHHDSALLLLDDLDALLGRMPQEYQDEAIDCLVRILRNGPSANLAVVATAVSVTAVLRRVSALFSDTLLLRQPSRQEHVMSGGAAELFDEAAHPGSGVWRGHRIQVAVPSEGGGATEGLPQRSVVPQEHLCSATILVTRSPGARIRSLNQPGRDGQPGRDDQPRGARNVVDIGSGTLPPDFGHGILEISTGDGAPRPTILVGDPEAWQSNWSLFGSLRNRCRIVFDGCALADVRALLQTRTLPPLIAGTDRVWVREAGETLSRARLVLPSET